MSEEDDTIEIKAKKHIFIGDAKKISNKGTVKGVVSRGKISRPARDHLDDEEIAWAQNIKEKEKERE